MRKFMAAVFFAVFLAQAAGAAPDDGLGYEYQPTRGGRLEVVIKSEARCVFGDFNAIYLDFAAEARSGEISSKLLLSLEPLGSAQAASSVQELKLGAPVHAVKVPSVQQATLMGLFICRDSNDEKSCRDKDVVPFDEIMLPHQVSRSERGNFHAMNKLSGADISDKVYFFRFLLVEPGGVVSFPTERLTDEGYDRFEALLQKRSGRANQTAFQRARFVSAALQSEPIAKTKRGISIQLPHYNPLKCGAKMTK